MTKNQRLIEQAAKEVVRKAKADAMLLGPLVGRLLVYFDGKLGEGDAGLVVRAKDDPKLSPDDVLRAMRDESEFADYFPETGDVDPTLDPERDAEAYEAETQRLIEAAFRRQAPNGDPFGLAPTTRINIAREIREQRGGKPLREVSPTRRERPTLTVTDTEPYVPGSFGTRLKELRRKEWERGNSSDPNATNPVAKDAVGQLKQERRKQPGA